MTPDEKIQLLDETVSTAIASWRTFILVDKKYTAWAEDAYNAPEYDGCRTLRVLLSHSLMSACYASMERGKRSYSMFHAVKDPDLIVSPLAKEKFKQCDNLWPKITKYRNNVTAHVNTRRTQSEWADFAGIRNGEIDAFANNAPIVIEELCKANLGVRNLASSSRSFQREFLDFCRILGD